MTRIPTRGSVALTLLLAGVLGLSGCAGGSSIDLSSADTARHTACDQVQTAVDKLVELVNEDSPGKRNRLERELNVDVNDDAQLDAAMAALNERAERCARIDKKSKDEPEQTPSPSASPSDEAPVADPVSDVVGWDQVPPGTFRRIKEHRSELGFTADDARTWAVATLPSGDLADARVVLIFGLPDTTDAKARSLVEVPSETPVVRVESCTDIDGDACAEDMVRVILAPLVIEDGVVTGKKAGAGVVLKGNFPLITYTS